MIRKLIVLLLICLPCVVSAQRLKIAKITKVTPQTTQVNKAVSRAARMAQFSAFQRAHPLQDILLHTTPTPSLAPRLKNAVLTTQQRDAFLTKYKQTLRRFAQFKKKSISMLYYQSIPSEAREMLLIEKTQWLDEIIPLHEQVRTLLAATWEDAALQYAQDYLQYSLSVVDPFLLPSLTAVKPHVQIPEFDPQAFFLYAADAEKSLQDPSIDLDDKTILILNDDPSLLDYFDQLAHTGILFPGAHLNTEGNGLQMLLTWSPPPRTGHYIYRYSINGK